MLALDSSLVAQAVAIDAAPFASLLPLLPELPSAARPWVYWFWFNGNVTREGLTADLEAMHAVGIGGAMILWTGFGAEAGPARYMSEVWYDMVRHVLVEARRLGLQIDVNNDDGWSDAGGPWVPSELAMQKVVWNETQVEGGKPFSGSLPQPEMHGNFYRDIAIVAFPALPGSEALLPTPRIQQVPGTPAMIVHDYGVPVTVRSADVQLWAEVAAGLKPVTFDIEASTDEQHFSPVYHFDNHWRWTGQQVSRSLTVDVHFPVTTARYFRMVLPYTQNVAAPVAPGKQPPPKQQSAFKLFTEDRVALWSLKAGYAMVNSALEQPEHYAGGWINEYQEQGVPILPESQPGSAIALDRIVQLSDRMVDNRLDWTPPQGRWSVLRIGYTAVGATVHTASKEGRGPVVNPFLREAMDLHFAADLKKLIDRNKAFVGNALYAYHMDSSEAGPSNWSPTLTIEFEKRRGYSLMPWLPVIAGGHIVESLAHSERLLWDFRRTLSDLMAENCWGRLAELSHQNGGVFSAEASGRMQFLSDPLLYLSKCDLPMGEFWPGERDPRPDCNNCRAVANVHGKKVVLGEAFTDASWNHSPNAGEWQSYPYSLKQFGDRAFCAGVNHYVFHRYIAQPRLNDFPGVAWGTEDGRHVGINMERTNTWWKPGAAWIAYLARCGYMLQAGREVVDVLVLVDEGAPNRVVQPEQFPAGYRYDGLHPNMLKSVTVHRGDLVLPSGMTYRVLVLPPLGTMRPETAREIARLAGAGAMLVGKKPAASPSLSNYPACDAEVRRIAASWGPVYATVDDVLNMRGLRPDFLGGPDVQFMHRTTGTQDHYFVSNQSGRDLRIEAEFRIEGRVPELLDPDTGLATTAAIYRSAKGSTIVPLVLDRASSLFVVFRRQATDPVVSQPRLVNNLGSSLNDILVEGLPDSKLLVTTAAAGPLRLQTVQGRKAKMRLDRLPKRELRGPWKLVFPPNWGAPASVELPKLMSWGDYPEPGVQHFSGTATYMLDFNVAPDELSPMHAVFLDLGDVKVIAEIVLNGKAMATCWKPPFRWDLTDVVLPGKNYLQVQVTNLWPNRLIGDSALPEEKRYTHTNFNPYHPDTKLLPSGILGPAMLIFANRRMASWE